MSPQVMPLHHLSLLYFSASSGLYGSNPSTAMASSPFTDFQFSRLSCTHYRLCVSSSGLLSLCTRYPLGTERPRLITGIDTFDGAVFAKGHAQRWSVACNVTRRVGSS